MFENAGFIDENGDSLSAGSNLTSEQEQFIMHISYQIIAIKKYKMESQKDNKN